jgi:hypothetical protein
VTWTQISTNGPARVRPGLAYDSKRGVSVLFGGRSSPGALHGDTWEWDGIAWQLRANTGPSPREAHAMAYDSTRGVTVLFGGFNGTQLGDTWEWDGTLWTQRLERGPSPREQSELAFDVSRDRMVLYGGSGAGVGNEVWEWDGIAWAQITPVGPLPPGPRVEFTMTYHGERAAVVLFGGYDLSSGAMLGDLWMWDGQAFTLLAGSGPPARYGHALAYDSARDRLIMTGGIQDFAPPYAFADVWEWNGAAWSQMVDAGLSARLLGAMCFDTKRGVSVLMGGLWHSNDMWETRAATPPVIQVDPLSITVESGRSARLFIIAHSPLGAPPSYQWRKDGQNLANGNGISGANTAVLTLTEIDSASSAGQYDVVVSHACGSVTSAAATLTVQTPCPADVNGSGAVDVDDLIDVILGWGACP